MPQLWNRTLVHSVGSQVGVHWTPIISLQQLRSDMMARYPDYQVEPSEPAPNKPTSLGLSNFKQVKPEKKAHLPLSPSLEAWLTVQANTLVSLTRIVQPHLSHNENLQLAGNSFQRYLLDSCRSLEDLEIPVTVLFSHLK